jgi:hypothetical protein
MQIRVLSLVCAGLFVVSCGTNDESLVSNVPLMVDLPTQYHPIQSRDWSCGPNSVARFFDLHRVPAKYEDVRDYAEPKVPGLNLPSLGIHLKFGSSPELIRDLVNHWVPQASVQVLRGQGNLNALKDKISRLEPALALIQTGTQDSFLGKAPILHWVMIVGWDERKGLIKISDPGFAKPYWESTLSFQSRWLWSLPSGGLASLYSQYGYQPGTLVLPTF